MPQFTDPEAVAERIHNNPAEAVSLLDTILTAEQAESLESLLIPVPGPEERAQVLREAHRMLKRAGLPDDDAIVDAIRRETESAG